MDSEFGADARSSRSAQLLAHRPLVRRIALRMRSRLPVHVDTDELMQAGMIALNDALTRFQEGRGASFGTYAARRIEGAMLDSLRADDSLPRGVRSRLREVQAAVHLLEHRLGRTPRAREVAAELGWTLEAFHRCMSDAGAGGVRQRDTTLDRLDDEPSGFAGLEREHSAWATLTGCDEAADPLRSLQQRQRHDALGAAFDMLDERERRVMELIYERELTLNEIGSRLGVTAARVSQLHEAVLRKLRLRLRDW